MLFRPTKNGNLLFRTGNDTTLMGIYAKSDNNNARKEEIVRIHGSDVTGGVIIKRAIAGNSGLEAFSWDFGAPALYSTARILAEIPVRFPKLFSDLFKCYHCNQTKHRN
nr:hypothetical protein Itr_chr03CG19230 [Ipomoea trifida]